MPPRPSVVMAPLFANALKAGDHRNDVALENFAHRARLDAQNLRVAVVASVMIPACAPVSASAATPACASSSAKTAAAISSPRRAADRR